MVVFQIIRFYKLVHCKPSIFGSIFWVPPICLSTLIIGLGRSQILCSQTWIQIYMSSFGVKQLNGPRLSLNLELFRCRQDLRPDAAMYCHFLGLASCKSIGFTPKHSTRWRVRKIEDPQHYNGPILDDFGAPPWLKKLPWRDMKPQSHRFVLFSSWWFEVPPAILRSHGDYTAHEAWNVWLQVGVVFVGFTWGVMATLAAHPGTTEMHIPNTSSQSHTQD